MAGDGQRHRQLQGLRGVGYDPPSGEPEEQEPPAGARDEGHLGTLPARDALEQGSRPAGSPLHAPGKEEPFFLEIVTVSTY